LETACDALQIKYNKFHSILMLPSPSTSIQPLLATPLNVCLPTQQAAAALAAAQICSRQGDCYAYVSHCLFSTDMLYTHCSSQPWQQHNWLSKTATQNQHGLPTSKALGDQRLNELCKHSVRVR
jgi:hypothetical protein